MSVPYPRDLALVAKTGSALGPIQGQICVPNSNDSFVLVTWSVMVTWGRHSCMFGPAQTIHSAIRHSYAMLVSENLLTRHWNLFS